MQGCSHAILSTGWPDCHTAAVQCTGRMLSLCTHHTSLRRCVVHTPLKAALQSTMTTADCSAERPPHYRKPAVQLDPAAQPHELRRPGAQRG